MESGVFLLLVTVAGIISCVTSDDPQPADPRWPDVFQQTFTEKFYYPVIGTHTTSGTFYYDFPNKRYRVDRANGRYDRYCGFNGVRAFQDTPCTHLVLNGVRWLVYPEKQSCCKCCDAAHGCGVLKPTWLTGAKYLGVSSYQGVQAYSWDQKGLQSNIYRETVADATGDRVMLEIDQQPNDTQYFDPASRKLAIDDPDTVFALPSYCKDEKCSLLSACRAVGLSD